MSRLLMLSGASKMVFDPRRCKKSSTSRSTVRRGGLSTKKHETSDYPVKSHNSPTTAVRPVVNDSKEPLGTMALHWPQEIDQVSIPESGLAGLVCFSSVSFFSRQGFLAS